jgi:DNA modification methylase
MANLESGTIDAVITDPPYGISYQSAWRSDKARWHPPIANDDTPCVDWLPDAYRVLKPNTPLVCFCRWDVQEVFRQAITAAGFEVKSQIIWDKVTHGMGDLNGEFAPQHEIALFAAKGRYTFPGERPKTIIRATRLLGESMVHPTEKPTTLLGQLIVAPTRHGDLILDPFAGSGSTGVAAIKEGRRFIGSELDPGYHAIAMKRLGAAYQQPRLMEATA